MNRYNRHIVLKEIGQKGQNKINNAKVLVVGAGGLGCPTLQYLTAAGVGTIGIIDFDNVEESNLQRQILFGNSNLGQNKAIAAKKSLQNLNNTITITAFPEKLTHKNALQLFKNYDIIVDGTDNFTTRYLINDAAIITNKPLVYGGIYKFEGQVSVFNYNEGPSYRCLFPNPPKQNSIPNCIEIGVLGVLAGIIGTMQANEVLKIILNLGEILSGKILLYNALNTSISILKIHKNETEINKILSNKDDFQNKKRDHFDDILTSEISITSIFNKTNIQLIDVRELHEQPKIKTFQTTKIPLSNLENNLDKIDANKEKVIFCSSGIRSKTAVSILKKHQIKNSYSVKEGIKEVVAYFEKSNYER